MSHPPNDRAWIYSTVSDMAKDDVTDMKQDVDPESLMAVESNAEGRQHEFPGTRRQIKKFNVACQPTKIITGRVAQSSHSWSSPPQLSRASMCWFTAPSLPK